jgi:hypothetical protein
MSAPVPDLCLCRRPLPVHLPPRSPAKVCSYWCSLVKKGTFTLAQVEPMLLRERGPIPGGATAEPEQDDLFGGGA